MPRNPFFLTIVARRMPVRRRSTKVAGVPFQETDGGKKGAGFTEERNDCCVRAFALSHRAPYALGYLLAHIHGNRFFKGGAHWYKMAKVFNYQRVTDKFTVHAGNRRLTLARLYSLLPRRGTFVVVTTDHTFTVQDGVLLDTHITGNRSRVESIWRAPETRPARLLTFPTA
jgi:hypothetical protein